MERSAAEEVFEGARRVNMGILNWILLTSGVRRVVTSRTYRQ